MSRTTTAPVCDDARTATIHEGLKHKELLPHQHLVGTGYVDAQLLHRSQQDYGIDLVGPTRADYKWQAQQKIGCEAGQFRIDWQTKQATCPEGRTSSSWTPAIDKRQNEGDLDQMLEQGLPMLSEPFIVYAFDASASYHYRTAPTALSSAPPSTSAREDGRLQGFLCASSWGRRTHFGSEFERWGCAALALLAKKRRICSALSRLLLMNIVRLMRWLDGEPHAQTRRSALVQLLRPAA